jgi:hypothetical protein
MTDELPQISDRPPVGDLSNFVYGVDEKNALDIEVAVDEKGKVVVFHNRPFKKDIAWFEFDLGTSKLDFILDDGDIRDAGLFVTSTMAKYMQNSHQILMVLIDNDSGAAKEGNYVPLIIHRKD